MNSHVMELSANVQAVQERIAMACQRAGRSPDEVMLVAVSKKKPTDLIVQAVEAGLTDFGENRLEEAALKIPQVAQLTDSPPRWHMVGHVQSRKAQDVVNLGFVLVHSLDTLKLARRYNHFAEEAGLMLPVLLEVNISGEETKAGWVAYNWNSDNTVRTALWLAVEEMLALPNLRIEGLMTMAPFYDEPEATRPTFRAMAGLRAALQQSFPQVAWPHLSMGMTNDYEVAIEEGATIVRIGRAIFGERT